jgi:hypothetical protein
MPKVSRRRTDQFRDFVAVLKLGAVDLQHRPNVANERLRSGLDQPGLTGACGPREQTVSQRTSGVCVAVIALLIGLIRSAGDKALTVGRLLVAGAIIGVGVLLAKVFLNRLLRSPNPPWQFALACAMLFFGKPRTWIFIRWLDPIYLRSGPRYRP